MYPHHITPQARGHDVNAARIVSQVERRLTPTCGHWLALRKFHVIWWNWKTNRRLALVSAIACVATIPSLWIGAVTKDWRVILSGTAFFFLPMILAWLLFVGLTTGRMPSAYGRSELRASSPTWFWLTAGIYAGLVLLFLYFVLEVVLGGPFPSF